MGCRLRHPAVGQPMGCAVLSEVTGCQPIAVLFPVRSWAAPVLPPAVQWQPCCPALPANEHPPPRDITLRHPMSTLLPREVTV